MGTLDTLHYEGNIIDRLRELERRLTALEHTEISGVVGPQGATGATGPQGPPGPGTPSPLTRGDLIIVNSTPEVDTLAIGGARNLLQTNAGGTDPEWTAAISVSSIGIGTITVPHGAVGIGLLALEGTNADTAGPHIQLTTATDNYPIGQLAGWSHDSAWLGFDIYYDGANWKSSSVTSNFVIYKGIDLIIFCDESIAVGNNTTLLEGMRIDHDGNVGIGGIDPDHNLVVQTRAADSALPVMRLYQQDVDEPFLKLDGTTAADITYSLVDAADAGGATPHGFWKVEVNDRGGRLGSGDYYVPLYTLA